MSVCAISLSKDHIDMCSDSIVVMGRNKVKSLDVKKMYSLKHCHLLIVGNCIGAKYFVDYLNNSVNWDKVEEFETIERFLFIEVMLPFVSHYKNIGNFDNPAIIVVKDKDSVYRAFYIIESDISEIISHMAIGAGEIVARTALHLGMTAEKAIQTAIELCTLVDGPVVSIRLDRNCSEEEIQPNPTNKQCITDNDSVENMTRLMDEYRCYDAISCKDAHKFIPVSELRSMVTVIDGIMYTLINNEYVEVTYTMSYDLIRSDWHMEKEINGYPVTHIGDDAFKFSNMKAEHSTDLVIPDHITHIGNRSFEQCNLKSLVIGENVVSIGNDAFSDNDLHTVNIPKNVTNIGICAFANNKLTDVNLNKFGDTLYIQSMAFKNNNLEIVVVPPKVIFDGDDVFISNLENLSIHICSYSECGNFDNFANSWNRSDIFYRYPVHHHKDEEIEIRDSEKDPFIFEKQDSPSNDVGRTDKNWK